MIAAKISVMCLSPEDFVQREAVILFTIKSDPSQGFMDLVLVSIVAVYSLGITSDYICFLNFSHILFC
jgi:hypothetical protein